MSFQPHLLILFPLLALTSFLLLWLGSPLSILIGFILCCYSITFLRLRRVYRERQDLDSFFDNILNLFTFFGRVFVVVFIFSWGYYVSWPQAFALFFLSKLIHSALQFIHRMFEFEPKHWTFGIAGFAIMQATISFLIETGSIYVAKLS